MSNEFIPGQNARAIRNTRSADGVEIVKNAQVTVEHLPKLHDERAGTFLGRLQGQTGLILTAADFEPVEPPAPYKAPISDTPAAFPLSEVAWLDDDPAPLDPSQVKAGDTVTLEASGGRRVTAPVSERTLEGYTEGTWFLDVYYDNDKPQSFSAVHWTLTAHQPAPEPEPVWEVGTTGLATVSDGDDLFNLRVMRVEWDGIFGFATESGRIIADEAAQWSVSDFEPDEPRPLPSREQIAEAIYGAMYGGDWAQASSPAVDVYLQGADAVMPLLRGESR